MTSESAPIESPAVPPPGNPPPDGKTSTGRIIAITCGVLALLVVIAVLLTGLLAAIALPKFLGAVESAKEGQAQGIMGSINSALSMYYADNRGTFPVATTPVAVQDLVVPKYLAAAPKTPWQDDYFYLGDGVNYCLWCRDGKGGYLVYDSVSGRMGKSATEPELPASKLPPSEL